MLFNLFSGWKPSKTFKVIKDVCLLVYLYMQWIRGILVTRAAAKTASWQTAGHKKAPRLLEHSNFQPFVTVQKYSQHVLIVFPDLSL